jgi:hypothetical protein
MFAESVQAWATWMRTHDGDPDLLESITRYLTSRGEGSMTTLVHRHDNLSWWAREHDILGWDSFLEGRIGNSLFEIQDRFLRRIHSRRKIKTWATQFIQQVLSITHDQWLYRNARIHIRQLEGKTAADHLKVIQAVTERLIYEASDLLPQHTHLLSRDFTTLGSGSTMDRQYWIANMDSAIAAARIASAVDRSPDDN